MKKAFSSIFSEYNMEGQGLDVQKSSGLNTLVSLSYFFKCSCIFIKAHPYFQIIMGQVLEVQKPSELNTLVSVSYLFKCSGIFKKAGVLENKCAIGRIKLDRM